MWGRRYGTAPLLYRLGATMDEWAQRIAAEVDGPIAAVGASMGGYCAQRLLSYAEVQALVLVGSRADADTPERKQARDETIRLIEDQGLEALWEKQRPALFPEDADEDVVARARRLALEQDPAQLVVGVAAMRERPDSTELVRETGAKVLVARGEHDPFLSAEEAEALAVEAPMGSLHTFRGCGHLPSLEQPEEFDRVLEEFLADV
jgi:pimeloyl-ACP methyl ester carboxylesterase